MIGTSEMAGCNESGLITLNPQSLTTRSEKAIKIVKVPFGYLTAST